MLVHKRLAQRNRARVAASLGKNQKKAVRKVVRTEIASKAERKFLDGDLGNLTANSTAGFTATLITPPAQGNGNGQRVGDDLYMTSIEVDGRLDTSTNKNAAMRVMLIQWNEDNAVATPAAANIFTNTTNNDLLTAHYVINPDRKYKVLYDRKFYFDANNDSALKHVKIKLFGRKLGSRSISFNPAAITGVGNYFILTMGVLALGTLTATNTRLRYLDM